ncbi:MAG: diaminopimelate epimerase [Lachnospiraceae bacterium]
MKFTKMQGCGNDYIYVNCFEEKVPNPSETAIKVSDVHFGIGSDGMILISPSESADFKMSMYNADGSEGKMCGNGIRCVAKYVYDNGLTDKTTITVETLSGIKTLDLTIEDGRAVSVKVDMGKAQTKPELIPVIMPGDKSIVKNEPVVIDGKEYRITCVSMGNPHCIVFVDSVKDIDIEKIGPMFENNPIFPDRINTEFIQVTDRKNINMRVWERGSGETFACGTGACASVVAGVLNGKTDNEVCVHLLGGDLDIKYMEEDGTVFMTGPAVTVCKGEIDI